MRLWNRIVILLFFSFIWLEGENQMNYTDSDLVDFPDGIWIRRADWEVAVKILSLIPVIVIR